MAPNTEHAHREALKENWHRAYQRPSVPAVTGDTNASNNAVASSDGGVVMPSGLTNILPQGSSNSALLQTQLLQQQLQGIIAAASNVVYPPPPSVSPITTELLLVAALLPLITSQQVAAQQVAAQQQQLDLSLPQGVGLQHPSAVAPLLAASSAPLLTQQAAVPSLPNQQGQVPLRSVSPTSEASSKSTENKEETDSREYIPRKTTSGEVFEPFPQKLYRMIQEAKENNQEDVIAFFPHGRAFVIHKPRVFVSEIMPRYLTTKQFSSFQRQLNLYKFKRIHDGPDTGGYYHEHFINGQPELLRRIRRKPAGSTKNAHSASSVAPVAAPSAGMDLLTAVSAILGQSVPQHAAQQDATAVLERQDQVLQQDKENVLKNLLRLDSSPST